ncbi:hypothetical protein IPM62_04795 [Candidatus Woesebacteria bacterium]|nr:MAG: hypothetical protein IPM62_04795 [Candidatus Woesebacteria bacterium]
MKNANTEKIKDLKSKLNHYESILKAEMKGYRGVVHESAASEIKHTKVMVYTAMVDGLKKEIRDLEN